MKKVWTLAIMAIAFVSCSNDQEIPVVSTKGDVALSLTGSASSMVITKGSGEVELPASTSVGVYALEMAPGSFDVANTPLKNRPYVAIGVSGSFTAATPLYLDHAKTYKALAYAPSQNFISDDKAVSFGNGADVLYASPADVAITTITEASWSAAAKLSFVHKMSQATFKLVSGAGSPDLSGATFNVTGFNESCTMDLTDGKVTPVKGAGAVMTKTDVANCFIPNSADMTLNLVIKTTDKRVYNATLVKTFLSGYSYVFTVTLNKNDTKLEITGTVIDWVSVPGGEISTEG